MSDRPVLLDVDDLARMLGLTRRAVYNRRHRRHGGSLPPATLLGRSLRWRLSDVERWLADQTEATDND